MVLKSDAVGLHVLSSKPPDDDDKGNLTLVIFLRGDDYATWLSIVAYFDASGMISLRLAAEERMESGAEEGEGRLNCYTSEKKTGLRRPKRSPNVDQPPFLTAKPVAYTWCVCCR